MIGPRTAHALRLLGTGAPLASSSLTTRWLTSPVGGSTAMCNALLPAAFSTQTCASGWCCSSS
eukprot:151048-Chlamydomonas_euryale.AAC.1